MPALDILLNERAGSATAETRGRIEAACAAAGLSARIVAVPGAGLAAAARTAADDGRVIVAAGGDGTVSTVAAVAAEAGSTFGVIPIGTLNHFARDAGIPLDLDAAVRAIADGHSDALDVADANGRTFANNISAGLYARIVRERQIEQRRGHAKWTAFAMGLARAWLDYRPITVRLIVDGTARVVRTPFVFVGNGDYVIEGFDIGRRTSMATGHLSVCTAPDCSRADMLKLLARALAGQLAGDVALEATTAREVTIEPRSRQMPLAADGELVAMGAPIHCRNRHGVLRTLRPAAAPP